ncbi:acyl-CoA dehydrogenase family protein [Phytohabitans houttuyneae]|uniref:Acyl-CoA oxidase/dehydrogenase middle domain-containing protein n=1 Tax=Phytohabitans houttuyneae TaxID=1076126 RepID=A0A6V8JXD2_9ACTN|nr:acyl-CoA dehydrogenase family protein [Phytohabitans houttuyneae]GFJ77413.1 hypothetical protein Phou_015930 [Phytohabitans houttuyneae]
MTTALAWLEPLRSSTPELDHAAWDRLRRLAEHLAEQVSGAPQVGDRPARTRWLLDLRRRLAGHGHHTASGPSGLVWQTLAQFCAGFHDLDLRDATGPGHGAMILADATETTAATWRARFVRGDLVGIAATERHGGSRVQEITTRARLHRDGRWRVSGEKCWVSRLVESAGFVVFLRDPDGRITAAVVDAGDRGLEREVIEPFGLGGWSWGVLRPHDVPVDPAAVAATDGAPWQPGEREQLLVATAVPAGLPPSTIRELRQFLIDFEAQRPRTTPRRRYGWRLAEEAPLPGA